MRFKDRLLKDIETYKKIPTWKRKVNFVLEYYGVSLAIVLVVLGLLINTLVGVLGQKEVVLYAVLVNSDSVVHEVDESVFYELLEVDHQHQLIEVNDDLYLGISENDEEDISTMQVLTALFTVSDLDVFAADEKSYELYASQNAFADLTPIIDNKAVDLYYYEEVPVGIILHEGSKLHQAGYYHDEVIIGIAANAYNAQMAIKLVEGLLD
ncbi:MAG: hypothetical protein HUJ56_11395 [Erysipelotrichaceae bacterium]|nr:hypothetical protein [Erysipelotrichaceae bacterium]